MISAQQASQICETYIASLVASDLDAVLDLFDDNAVVEDPVGTELKEGKEALRAFYQVACNSVTAGQLNGPVRFAGSEVAFPFTLTVGAGEQAMTLDIIDVFRFNEAGKVVSMRAYWGPENMRAAG